MTEHQFTRDCLLAKSTFESNLISNLTSSDQRGIYQYIRNIINVVRLLYTADTIMIVGGLLFSPLTYYPPLSIDCGGVGRCTRILSAWVAYITIILAG